MIFPGLFFSLKLNWKGNEKNGRINSTRLRVCMAVIANVEKKKHVIKLKREKKEKKKYKIMHIVYSWFVRIDHDKS